MYRNVLLVVVVLVAAFIHQSPGRSLDNDSDEKDGLSKKEIKEKFVVLTNEVLELKHDLHELKSQITQTDGQAKGTPTVTMVKRQAMPDDVFRLTVQYTGPPNGHLWQSWTKIVTEEYKFQQEVLSSQVSEPRDNVFESSVITTVTNSSTVRFTLSDGKTWIILHLRNSPGGDLTQTDIKVPTLEVVPDGDFVYNPGHNMTIKVSTPLKQKEDPSSQNHRHSYRENFYAQYYLIRPEDTKVFTRFTSADSDNPFFQMLKKVTYLDREEMSFELNTAAFPISGVTDMTSALNMDDGLVERIEIGKQIVLRPKTQTGPFPEDRPYTVNNDWKKKNDKGEYISTCSVGDYCYFHCLVLGNDITKLQAFKTVNGQTQKINFDTRIDVLYQKVGIVGVIPEPGVSSTATYSCVGTNSQGMSVTEITQYHFGIGAKILKDESGMEKFDNGSALVTCAAQGQPLPQVTISCTTSHPSNVISQSDDVIRIATICDDVNNSWAYFSCNAENNLKSDFYTISNGGNNSTPYSYIYDFF